MTGHDLLYAILILAGFLAALALMQWDVTRQCEKAQREADLDELWDDAEPSHQA